MDYSFISEAMADSVPEFEIQQTGAAPFPSTEPFEPQKHSTQTARMLSK